MKPNTVDQKEFLKQFQTLKIETVYPSIENTIGLKQQVLAETFPKKKEDIIQIVKLARKFKIPLYPISIGANTGYGDKSPWKEQHIVINMCLMNKIISFDNNVGTIIIQPGVTQQQLFDYLKSNNSNYWMDVTGAGPETSIVGNIADGGFGHTPLGYKRKSCTNFEVVLGTGEIINTDSFPAIGPELSPLFIQSNFGIIISLELELFPKTDCVEMVMISAKKKDHFCSLMNGLQILKQKNVIDNLAHIYNPLRLVIALGITPAEQSKLLSNDDAYDLLKRKMPQLGYWNCSAAIYGTKQECKLKKLQIRKILSREINVQFYSKQKINFLKKISSLKLLTKFSFFKKTNDILENLANAREVFEGKSYNSEVKNHHLKWKQNNIQSGGLLWYAPTLRTNPLILSSFYSEIEKLFNDNGFDFPVTFTLITKQKTNATISIHYNKSNKSDVEKAILFYQTLEKYFSKQNINPYRCPIVSSLDFFKQSSRYQILKKLKHVFDPDNIIAQQRYIN